MTIGGFAGAHLLACGVAAVGFGRALTQPATAAVIARLLPEFGHHRAFTAKYAISNLGMALGAVGGAAVMYNGIGPGAKSLWWAAALAFGVAAATIAVTFPRPPAGAAQVRCGVIQAAPSYRLVWADNAMRRVLIVALLTSVAGYGVYTSGLPVLAVVAHDSAVLSWAARRIAPLSQPACRSHATSDGDGTRGNSWWRPHWSGRSAGCCARHWPKPLS